MAFHRLGGRRLRRNILVSRLNHLARPLAFLRFAAEVALGISRKVGFPGGRAPSRGRTRFCLRLSSLTYFPMPVSPAHPKRQERQGSPRFESINSWRTLAILAP